MTFSNSIVESISTTNDWPRSLRKVNSMIERYRGSIKTQRIQRESKGGQEGDQSQCPIGFINPNKYTAFSIIGDCGLLPSALGTLECAGTLLIFENISSN